MHVSDAAPSPRQQYIDTTLPQYYVPIPERLVKDMGRNQIAIGLYALIGRLWRAQADSDGWVTLSTNDIALFDPSLSRGAILRGLNRLVRHNWIETQQGRKKKRFRPTWGLVRKSVQPWCDTAAILGRPKHVKTVRLDQQLLDTYIGRLTLRTTEPVVIDRYVAPMLSLEDVGAYASTLAGYPQTTTTLLRLGLVVDDCVVALPPLATILGQATEVTKRGIQRLGLAPIGDPQPPPAADKRPAVFFVTPNMAGNIIRNMTPNMADCERRHNAQNIPKPGDESAVAVAMPNMTWMTWSACISWINPQAPLTGLMGGLVQKKKKQPKQEPKATQNPKSENCCRRGAGMINEIDIKTEAEQSLIDAGVWSRTAKTLREAPLAAVRYALEQAHTAQARDIPAYAVGLLSSLKERQWQLPRVNTTETLDTAKYTTGEYAEFFQSSQEAWSERAERAAPAAPVPTELTPQALWQAVQSDLRGLMTPVVYQATVAQAWLARYNGSVVVLEAPTNTVRNALIEQCVAPLKQSLARLLGLPTIKLVVQLGAPSPAARPTGASPQRVEHVARVDEDRPAAVAPSRPAAQPPAQAVETLPGALAEVLPALQQQLRHRAGQRRDPALALVASAIQSITVERETTNGLVELTPAVPTDLWRPEVSDLVVLTVGQSQRLEDLVKEHSALLAEELGSLVDRRLTADDIVVRQQAHKRPRRIS